MSLFKKNTEVAGFPFHLVSSTDGSDVTTGTTTVYYTLDGGTQTSLGTGSVHEGNGEWTITLTAAAMNGDIIGITCVNSAAITAHFTIKTDTVIVSDLNDFDPAADTVATVTTLTNLPAITTDWLTATGIAANALNDAGNWNVGKAGYTITGTITTLDGLPTVQNTVDGVWDETLTSGNHNVVNSAGRRLRNIQDFGIYDLASVWVDEINGTSTGTTEGEDATVTNRATDFDNAQTIAASVGLDRITVQNGNSITLSATINSYNVMGENYSVALGGQDIGNTCFYGASISGTGTGTTPQFDGGTIATATLPPCRIRHARLTTTLTVGSAGNYQLSDCFSGVAGSGSPTIDMGSAVGATTLELRRWSGGLSLTNVQVGDVVSVDCVSGGTISVNGTGGDVHIRGMVAVNDLSGGGVTITQTQAISNTSINAEMVDTLVTDTYAEPGQGTPAATASLKDKIGYLAKFMRNRKTATATTISVYNDDATTVDQKSTISDDGTTYDEGEFITGP